MPIGSIDRFHNITIETQITFTKVDFKWIGELSQIVISSVGRGERKLQRKLLNAYVSRLIEEWHERIRKCSFVSKWNIISQKGIQTCQVSLVLGAQWTLSWWFNIGNQFQMWIPENDDWSLSEDCNAHRPRSSHWRWMINDHTVSL